MGSKSGFTIVELVIVIAVIAILAAILIPVYANVTHSAKETELLQNARNSYTQYLADHAQDPDLPTNMVYVDGEQCVIIKKGTVITEVYPTKEDAMKALFNVEQEGAIFPRLQETEHEKLYACVGLLVIPMK